MIAEQKPLIFVYFNFRGKLQPVCHLAVYLGLAYIEIHYEEGEKEVKTLPADVVATVQSVKVDKHRLPLLIFEGLSIYDTYPIMAFLCRKFNRS